MKIFGKIKDYNIFSSVEYKKLVKLFNKDPAILDMLMFFPKRYDLLSSFRDFSLIKDGDVVAMHVRILSHSQLGRYHKMSKNRRLHKINAITVIGGINIEMMFFKISAWQIDKFEVGKEISIEGKVKRNGLKWQIVHPNIIANSFSGLRVKKKEAEDKGMQLDIPANNVVDDSIGQNIIPYYVLGNLFLQERFHVMMKKVFSFLTSDDFPVLPCEHKLLEKGFPDFYTALNKMHFPATKEDVTLESVNRMRLVHDEILLNHLALFLSRKDSDDSGIAIKKDNSLIDNFISNLPFKLTKEQEKVWKEISADHEMPKKMFRLLQGDVGSGKTIICILSMLHIVEAGKVGVLLVPTTILASQHYKVINNLTFGMNINVALLTGKTTMKQRNKILNDLASGSINIIVGTHAVITDSVQISNAGVFVIDEQHRFGVAQRSALCIKNPKADILMVTATPIPRTMGMMLYGDVKTSVMTEKPAGRLDIQTAVMSNEKYNSIVSALKRTLDGTRHKIYWICPAVEQSDTLISVEERFKSLQKDLKIDDKISYIHGKMDDNKKNNIISEFANGDKRVLVATSVIEVGIDVSEANIIIIEEAERFGLSQLHQLRGRVGRGGEQANCILVYSKDSHPDVVKKLQILRQYNDGFKIAQADMKRRGIGEIIGSRQSGLGSFKIADLSSDHHILDMVKENTQIVLSELIEHKEQIFGFLEIFDMKEAFLVFSKH